MHRPAESARNGLLETMAKRASVRLANSVLVAITLLLPACSTMVQQPAAIAPAAPTDMPSVQAITPTVPPAPTVALPQPEALSAEESLEAGIHLQDEGRYADAVAELRSLLASNPPQDVQRQALLHLAHASLQAGDDSLAADNLAVFLRRYPQDPQAPEATFWLGQARANLGDTAGAVEAFRSYLSQRPLLAGYVQGQIATALQKAGDLEEAAKAFRAAADAEPMAVNKVTMLEGLAGVERERRQPDQAVAAYDEILSLAQNAGYRAQIMFEAGNALYEAGRDSEAATRWQALIAAYPENSYAAQALALLQTMGPVQVDLLLQARVKYGAGDYAEALQVLHQIEAGGHTAAVHYYAALAYRKLGQHEDSVRELDALIQGHATSTLLVQALYEKGQSLALLGRVDDAVQTYRELNSQYPQQKQGIDALYQIAQAYDKAGRIAEASAAYVQAAQTYPNAAYAADARFRAGFVYYLSGAVQAAAKAWAAELPQEPSPELQARLHMWLGKAAAAQQDTTTAQTEWQRATALDPNGFWGLRAADLLAGRSFGGQAPVGAFDPALYAPRGDPAEAERWLESWTGQPVSSDLPQAVREEPAFQRGVEYWALGDSVDANAQLQAVQAAHSGEPGVLYALAVYTCGQGLYQISVTSAERLLAMAPPEARAKAPRFLEELAYPTYYIDLVLPEAQATNTDPLLFLALMRQESLFNATATSYADARGLTQVIPSTGEYIAQKIGDTTYTPEQLWRPVVSVRYGLWYFSQALAMFDDNALMALVGYNAGPGNAAEWGKQAHGDDDVYFEIVSNGQPRAYMERIYEHRAHYESLYR